MSDLISPRRLERLPALDAVRAVGAFAVVAHHVGFATGLNMGSTFVGGVLARLDIGVAIFFVLSGFLLFRPWAHAHATHSRRPATGRYLWRRAVRVLPAYWLMVAASLLWLPSDMPASLGDWLRHLGLVQIYEELGLRNGLGHTWSLATEVAFYLVLPLLAALALRGRRVTGLPVPLLVTGVLVMLVWAWLLDEGVLSETMHTMWLPSYGAWFGAGMALAAAHVSLRNGGTRWRFLNDLGAAPLACWAVAVALLGVASTPVAGPRDLGALTAREFAVKMLLYTVIAVLVLLPVAFGPATRTKSVFASGTARWLGTVSYGLFLWHPFVLEWVTELDGSPDFSGNWFTTYAWTIAIGLLVAAASYYLVERPLLRWGSQWPRRRPNATDTQSAVMAPTAAS
jgi:peptidoglycan/LPS O-acetylase OafA/YrhL